MSLFLECNDNPLMDGVDDGLTRRLRIYKFYSKFLYEDEYIIVINDIENNNDLKQDEKDTLKKWYCK